MKFPVGDIGVNVFGTPMSHRGRHFLGIDHHQTVARVIGKGYVAHIFLVARFLRLCKSRPLLADGAVIESRETGFLAVAIIIPWSASVPVEIFITFGHIETITNLGHCNTVAPRNNLA